MSKYRNYKKTVFILLIFFLSFYATENTMGAESVNELRKLIEERGEVINQLETEIQQYKSDLNQISREANTLEGAVKSLDISYNKLRTELEITESRIENANLNIQKLEFDIKETETKIGRGKEQISAILRDIHELNSTPLVLTFLSDNNIQSVWDNLEEMKQLQSGMKVHLEDLNNLKESLEENKKETEFFKADLISLQTELRDRREVVSYNRAERASLLEETRSEQAEYERLLRNKQIQKEQFEKELFEFESQLKRVIDPASIPAARPGLFDWPLDNVRITQLFGRTAHSGRLYQSGTHNGIDFGSSIGTPVKSVSDGVVEGTGNTDAFPGCTSWGKWILVKHDNGLSSMYAHLSVVSAQKGQRVGRGEVIAYSGSTGYSTGPHLHLTIYASQGVKIQQYPIKTSNCRNTQMPIADRKAYLDPMIYLPPYNIN